MIKNLKRFNLLPIVPKMCFQLSLALKLLFKVKNFKIIDDYDGDTQCSRSGFRYPWFRENLMIAVMHWLLNFNRS
jgi:hypothetical protein